MLDGIKYQVDLICNAGQHTVGDSGDVTISITPRLDSEVPRPLREYLEI